MPMLLEMIVWAAKYDEQTEAPAEFIASFENDRAVLIEQLKENLSQSN